MNFNIECEQEEHSRWIAEVRICPEYLNTVKLQLKPFPVSKYWRDV